MQSDIPQTLYK